MNPTPAGWPRISSSLYYRDPARMIDWLCAAFGFEARLKVEGEAGRIEHSELTYVDDVDAHCARARAAGAKISDEPSMHDYGADYWVDRSYGAVDPEGHMWWFTQRIRG